jgi:Flp pilus assembly protein CpaB
VAQQAGGVSLVLRSLVDAGKPTLIDRDPPLSIIRYGVEAQFGKR